VQVHQREPRTTLDVDVAVIDLRSLPRDRLAAAGFIPTGAFTHSENWQGPEETPVQFTDDAAFAPAISRAAEVDLEGMRLRVISKLDLLRAKLRSGADPARRKSKRLLDLADAQGLVEGEPGLATELTDAERALLARSP
jgi:hypothetical protein